jgi:hypothetical protein
MHVRDNQVGDLLRIDRKPRERPARLLEIGGAVKLYGLGPIETGIDQDDPS